MNKKISLFDCPINTIDAIPKENIYLSDFYLDIKNCRWKSQVDEYRTTQDKSIKVSLPKVTGCGTFKVKNDSGIEIFSNRIFVDLDKIIDISVKELLIKDPFIECVSLSCSGMKLFCVIKLPDQPKDKSLKDFYVEYFLAIESYFKNKYSLEIDPACKDISRYRFVTYDENIYFDFNKNVFTLSTGINHSLISICEKMIFNAANGEKNIELLKASRLAGGFIAGGHLIERFAIDRLFAEIKKRQIDSEGQAYKTICSGIRHGKLTPIFDVKNYDIEKIETFWSVKDGRSGKSISIENYRLMKFLMDNGFYNYQLGKESTILIKITENIVEQIDLDKIRQFILMFLEGLPEFFDGIHKDKLIELYVKTMRQLITKEFTGVLRYYTLDFISDSPTNAFLFYKNGIVDVSKDEISLIPYGLIKKHVWKDRIIQRDFIRSEQNEYTKSDFFNFVGIISGSKNQDKTQDEINQTFDSFLTSIGYILHNYKDPISSPCLILNDSIISEGANGGVGKGILINGIKYFKNVAKYDGKSFDFTKGFVWQRVNPDTEIIAIEDIKKQFNFEQMFSIITEGITVEKKNKNEFYLSFDKAPKFILTTNYAIKGDGSSFERRKIDLELDNYFNEKRTPFIEFGRRFFYDWIAYDWQLFDNFMVSCIMFYLKFGVVKQESNNILTKKIIVSTNRDFADFFIKNLQLNIEFKTEDMRLKFVSDNAEYEDLSSKKFINWIKTYAKLNSYVYESRRSNGDNISIIKKG